MAHPLRAQLLQSLFLEALVLLLVEQLLLVQALVALVLLERLLVCEREELVQTAGSCCVRRTGQTPTHTP